jgi:hypothetical protein
VFPYWLLFGVYAFGATQYSRASRSNQKIGPLFILVGLATFLMIAFRYKSGADWNTYNGIFDFLRELSMRDALRYGDPGYSLVNWLTGYLGLGFWFVNFVCGIFFTWGLMRFARAQPNPWLAVAVAVPYLIIVVGMGYTRQGVAIGFILAGLANFNSKSLLRFSVYIFLAASFHKTAIVVLPIIALMMVRNRFVGGLALLILSYVLYVTFLSSSVDTLITNYIDRQYESSGAAIRVIMNVIPSAIFLFWRNRFVMDNDHKRIWIMFSLASFLMAILLIVTPSSTAVDRLSLYLLPIQVVVLAGLPDAFPAGQGRNAQLVVAVIAYSALVQFIWFTFAVHSEYWIPYRLYPLFE